MEMTVSMTDLFLIIASISIIVLVTFLVPLLIQLRQTTNQTEKLIHNINAKLDEIDAIIGTAKYTGESLLVTSKLIRSVLTPTITQVGGLSSGIRAFYNVILGSKSKTKKGDENR